MIVAEKHSGVLMRTQRGKKSLVLSVSQRSSAARENGHRAGIASVEKTERREERYCLRLTKCAVVFCCA